MRSTRESGIALVTVLLVLLALVALATPFSLSMRHEDRGATHRVHVARAQAQLEATLSWAEERLSRTAPDRDPTPLVDGPEEWRLEPSGAQEGAGVEPRDPRAAIGAATASDVSGRADLVHPSLWLLHHLSGGTDLAAELAEDEEDEIRVSHADRLPDQGLLWIDGELVLYRQRSGNRLSGITRGFSTSLLESRPPGEHPFGTPAVDYRWIVALLRPFKIEKGRWLPYSAVRGLKSVSDLGEVAFRSGEVDALEPFLTVHAPLPASRSWVGGARLLLDAGPAAGTELVVAGGRNLGAGSLVRLREGDREAYGLVVEAVPLEGGLARLVLQEPPEEPFTGGSAVVEALARAPIDLNAAPRRVLAAWAEGVSLLGSSDRVDGEEAAMLAEALLAERPIRGIAGLARLLERLVAEGRLSEEDRLALLLDAENAADLRLARGTAPAVFRSPGRFLVEVAVSENLPAGREVERRFARVVTEPGPGGPRRSIFADQAEFEDRMRLSRGGRGWTTGPRHLDVDDDGNDPPSRVGAYAAGRFPRPFDEGADDENEDAGYARLAPIRMEGRRDASAAMPEGLVERMFHFDAASDDPEAPTSDDVRGWDFGRRGPFAVAVDSPVVSWLDPDGWMRPVALSFWWTPGDGARDGETYLFDCGDVESDKYAEITNRIWAFFDGRDLVFRVADASVPDPLGETFGSSPAPTTDEEWPAQFAEVRYSFDDGLEFEPDVPYHLTFYARGSKPTDLALFVDGVPRGRRAFQTRLREDLDAPSDAGPFANLPGYTAGQRQKIRVEDASLFPKFGVVRIDREIIEYTDRTDDELIVARVSGDAFGGRARRGSIGRKHLESEPVELYGYAGVLLSPYVPTGNVGLKNALGRFGVAMVDPESNAVKTPISTLFQGPDGNVVRQIGRGLDAAAQEIPLVPLADPNDSGSSSGTSGIADLFDPNGGFALLVSSPRPPPSNGGNTNLQDGQNRAQFSWTRVLRTPEGALIGLGELVYYSSFSGGRLEGVLRAPTAGDATQWSPDDHSNLVSVGAPGGDDDGNLTATVAHVHVFEWQNQYVQQGYGNRQPIFVVPISVRPGLSEAEVPTAYATPVLRGGNTFPEMVQIGRGFAGFEQGGGTEWVRYDVIGRGCFVRDDPVRIRRAVDLLARDATVNYTNEGPGGAPSAEALARALNYEQIGATAQDREKIAAAAGVPAGRLEGGVLAFRGVLGTGDRAHPAGALVLPVVRTIRQTVFAARPGPRDYVTLVDPVSRSREEERINYAYCGTDVERWGGSACHLAFDSGVEGSYRANFMDLLSAVDPNDPAAAMNALANQNVESRHLTRILKFPSGELPSALGEEVRFGGDLQGEPSPVGGFVDEIEFFTPETPSDVLPRHVRFWLSRDDELGDSLHLWRKGLRYNMWDRTSVAIEEIDPVAHLPEDGFVLLVDEELIAVEEILVDENENEAELRVAPAGRGFLGTAIQFHPQFAAAREMTFLRASRLEKSIDEDDEVIEVADASDFPARGYVLVGQEILGYERREENRLLMPVADGARGGERGLFRGRFGTTASEHEAGTLVVVFPARVEDRWEDLVDVPELTYLPLSVASLGATFRSLSWEAEGEGEKARLEALVGLGESVDFAHDPDRDPRLLRLVGAGAGSAGHPIGRQADRLEARFYVRFASGAFDAGALDPTAGPVRGGSNDWKRAPRLRRVVVDWLGRPTRLAYEEWR